jgi:16S rRNA A1518/A1519 N6-dimethyltransferase RsmA/KsgA/DIM1 with predicted DNA glycosylase/AP lyase activity
MNYLINQKDIKKIWEAVSKVFQKRKKHVDCEKESLVKTIYLLLTKEDKDSYKESLTYRTRHIMLMQTVQFKG